MDCKQRLRGRITSANSFANMMELNCPMRLCAPSCIKLRSFARFQHKYISLLSTTPTAGSLIYYCVQTKVVHCLKIKTFHLPVDTTQQPNYSEQRQHLDAFYQTSPLVFPGHAYKEMMNRISNREDHFLLLTVGRSNSSPNATQESQNQFLLHWQKLKSVEIDINTALVTFISLILLLYTAPHKAQEHYTVIWLITKPLNRNDAETGILILEPC